MSRSLEHRGFVKASRLSNVQASVAASDLFSHSTDSALKAFHEQMQLSVKYLSQGHLTIPLHKDFARVKSSLIAAVEKTPVLKKHISFFDKDETRPYEDVVFDLVKRPLECARALYTASQDKKYLLITPPTLGFVFDDVATIHCKPQILAGKKGDVAMQVLIETETDFWQADRKKAGFRHLIQSENIILNQRSEDWSDIMLHIHTRAAMAHEYNELAAPQTKTGMTYGL